MRITALELSAFRNYSDLTVTFDDGITVLEGDNGQGKTNLIEAIAFLASLRSFRGSPSSALVRSGSDTAVIRADVVEGERLSLFEVEIPREPPVAGTDQSSEGGIGSRHGP